jgi:hypothetical protein
MVCTVDGQVLKYEQVKETHSEMLETSLLSMEDVLCLSAKLQQLTPQDPLYSILLLKLVSGFDYLYHTHQDTQ